MYCPDCQAQHEEWNQIGPHSEHEERGVCVNQLPIECGFCGFVQVQEWGE